MPAALRFLSSNPRKSLNLRFGSKDRSGGVQRSVTWKPTWTSARSTRGHYGRAVAEGLGKPASDRNRGQRQMHESDCAVSRDGGSISLTLLNKDGKQCEVVLTFDEASSLAMTLPRLLKMDLRRRYSARLRRGVRLRLAPPARHIGRLADLTLSSQSASRLRLQLRVTWPSIGACLLRRSLVCRTEPAGCRGGAAIRGAPRPPWPKPRRER